MVSLTDYINRYKEKQRQWYDNSSVDDNEVFFVEGLQIDTDKKTVKLNDTSDGIDFEGPIEWKSEDGIPIISIFKRTNLPGYSNTMDGNPFIYALKNKFDWKFDISNIEIRKYCRKFVENCQKINRQFDTVIMIPSKSNINERFMKEISSFVKAKNSIENVFYKEKLDFETFSHLIRYDLLEKDYPEEHIRNRIANKIEEELDTQLEKYGEFQAKFFNKEFLKYLTFINANKREDYVDLITDKDVLILDDVYSSGETISQSVEALKQNYEPKSITVITLLSKKFK